MGHDVGPDSPPQTSTSQPDPLQISLQLQIDGVENLCLSGHLKTGHVWSLQNRPYRLAGTSCFFLSRLLQLGKSNLWVLPSLYLLQRKICHLEAPGGVLSRSAMVVVMAFSGAEGSVCNLVLQLRGPHFRI